MSKPTLNIIQDDGQLRAIEFGGNTYTATDVYDLEEFVRALKSYLKEWL